jgi:alpha-galactosidase
MGFGCYARDIGEATFMEMADAMASNGLRDAGYNWLNLDNGFVDGRAANGSLECHKTDKHGNAAFPSGTLKPLSAHLAAHNMSLGAYTDRGTMTCGNVAPGSEGHEAQDAQTFIDWGVRWIKSDSCSATSDFPAAADQYRKMAAGFRATGQEVFFSLCGWWAACKYQHYSALLGSCLRC